MLGVLCKVQSKSLNSGPFYNFSVFEFRLLQSNDILILIKIIQSDFFPEDKNCPGHLYVYKVFQVLSSII